MRKTLILTLFAFLLTGAFIAGCGDSGSSSSSSSSSSTASSEPAPSGGGEEAAAPAPAQQQTLVVANWKGYGSDSSYGAKVFEEKYNCKVVHQYFTSLEEMVTMLKQGGLGKIDVILPNSQYMKVVMDQGLVQKVDTGKITSFGDLRPDLRDYVDARDDEGNYYAMPWTWGTTSLGYNPKAYDQPVTSWKALWDPANKGKVGIFDEYYSAILVAGLYTGQEDIYNPNLEEMVTMLKQGGMGKIDVILPNSQYMKVVMDQGLAQKVDVAKISSFNDLRPDLRDYADAMDADGNYYAVPWTWGTTSLGYNPKAYAEPITSWKALWDPANKGKVGIFDEYYSAILVAGLYSGQEDIYNPNLAEIKAALIALKNNTRTFWASYDDFLKPYMAQEITIGNMWAGTASQLLSAGEPVAYVYPEEGTIAWADYWAIVKDAPNYDLALKWLDFMTAEEFQTAFATDENAHSPVNEKVAAQLTDDQKKILWLHPEGPAKIFMQKAEDPKQRSEWLEIWNEIKSY